VSKIRYKNSSRLQQTTLLTGHVVSTSLAKNTSKYARRHKVYAALSCHRTRTVYRHIIQIPLFLGESSEQKDFELAN